MVVHAAAPCPVDVKRQIIDWFGPIINEYYAGSEGNGLCAIGTEQWLSHPGSVGIPILGKLHIVGDDGNELPTRSLGDIGYLDDDGYLYLTDRASHMIISGGVNIYPQEVENELTMHPAVSDVAVIGVPNADLGEEVKAVVIAADPSAAGPALGAELIAFCRSNLPTTSAPPRSISSMNCHGYRPASCSSASSASATGQADYREAASPSTCRITAVSRPAASDVYRSARQATYPSGRTSEAPDRPIP